MKMYLGHAVYVDFDKRTDRLILTTEDGKYVSNRIILEPEVLASLVEYINNLRTGG